MTGVIEGAIAAAALNLARKGATELATRSETRIRDKVLGTPEEQALKRAWLRAFTALMARSRAAGLEPASRDLLVAWLQDFADDQEVGQQLLNLALAGSSLPIDELRRRCAFLGGDPGWFPGGFDPALTALVDGLTIGLREEAAQPDNPLFGRVSLAEQDAQRGLLNDMRAEMVRMSQTLFELNARVGVTNGITPFPAGYRSPEEGMTAAISLPPSGPGLSQLVDPAALMEPYDALARLVSEETRGRLEAMRDAWREGRGSEARAWVEGLQGDTTRWNALDLTVQAALLRFAARQVLDRPGGLAEARQLVDAAEALAPDDRPTLAAILAYRGEGADAALAILAGHDDADSRTLRAALLLELGRVDECLGTLDRLATIEEPGAEHLRLRALATFLVGDLEGARAAAEAALTLAPRWTTVRFVGAFIDYFASLSPLATARHLVASPEPVDWILVRRDDTSLARLRAAGEVFAELAAGAEEPEERGVLETWRLACLANDPGYQVEAAAYCLALLGAEPTHHRALAWALTRRWDLDLDPSRRALEATVAAGEGSRAHIVMLVNLELHIGTPERAGNLLDDARTLFDDGEARAVWQILREQAALAAGTTGERIDTSGAEPGGESPRARILALVAAASKTGEWAPLSHYLEENPVATDDSLFLLDICQLLAAHGMWRWVADRAEWLAVEVGTADAFRLAAVATFNDERPSQALRLLDEHRDDFAHGRLPDDLRLLRALCLQGEGRLPEAIVEAAALWLEESRLEHGLTLAQLHLERGDLASVTRLGGELVRRTDLTPGDALRVAQPVALVDRSLAVVLWRRAAKDELPDEDVAAAVSLGLHLGQDRAVGPLMARMAALATSGRGGVRALGGQEFLALVSTWHEQGSVLADAYRRGTAPIHIIAGGLGRDLIDLYHRLPEMNAEGLDPTRQPVLYTRHGGFEPDPVLASDAPWRVHMDVTALLLAAHLGILDAVEETFCPLRLPFHLLPALTQMLGRLREHRPTRLTAQRQILDLAARTAFEECPDPTPPVDNTEIPVDDLGEGRAALLAAACRADGYLIDTLPLQRPDRSGPVDPVSTIVSGRVLNCRTLADALHRDGPLSAEEYTTAVVALGSEGIMSTEAPIPLRGSILYCAGTLPEVLAEAGLFRPVCARFRLRIPRATMKRIRGEIAAHERCQVDADWLEELLRRLNRGIDDGTYIVLPLRTGAPGEGDRTEDDANEAQGLNETVLLDLFRVEPHEGDVVWADDRFLTTFRRVGEAPLVGIYEVLARLRDMGSLSQSDYYARLMMLRAANVRLIPVTGAEILYHLTQARVEEGRVVETQDLGTLRRYMASCILAGADLQRPPLASDAPNPSGEGGFVLELRRSVVAALALIWTEAGDDIAEARAEWLLENVYLDMAATLDVAGLLRIEQDPRAVEALGLAGFLTQALSLPNGSAPGNTARERYFRWLEIRVLRDRFAADPGLLVATTETWRALLTMILQHADSDEQRLVMTMVIQQLHEVLPARIRREFERDKDFMRRIGLPRTTVITIGDLRFPADGFWWAAAAAVNGKPAALQALEFRASIIFRPWRDSKGRRLCRFDHPITGRSTTFGDDTFGLLRRSRRAREETLRLLRLPLDCPDTTFERVVGEISAIAKPAQRMRVLQSWLASSTAAHFDQLYRRLAGHEEPLLLDELLPADAEGLLRHFRLSADIGPGTAFGDALAETARDLAEHDGLREALTRLAGLPVPLPLPLLVALGELEPAARHRLLKELLATPGSPLSRLHLARVLVFFGDERPAYGRLARRLLATLVGTEGRDAIAAFLYLVKWICDELGRRAASRVWPSHLRLAVAWGCAHRLFAIFTAIGTPTEFIAETFGTHAARTSPDWTNWATDLCCDITHPRQLSLLSFLLMGVAYAVEGDGDLIDTALRERLLDEAYPKMAGQPTPALSLLRDSTQAHNGLDSFLGGDRGERLAAILGETAAAPFGRSSLCDVIVWAVDQVASAGADSAGWVQLHAILGDLPPYPEVADQIADALKEIDIAAICRRDASVGSVAVEVAALRALHVEDEGLREGLRTQLVAIASCLAEPDESPPDVSGVEHAGTLDELRRAILEAGLLLAAASRRDPGGVLDVFASTITRVVAAWPVVGPQYRPTIQRLCDESAFSRASSLWALLVRLRAR